MARVDDGHPVLLRSDSPVIGEAGVGGSGLPLCCRHLSAKLRYSWSAARVCSPDACLDLTTNMAVRDFSFWRPRYRSKSGRLYGMHGTDRGVYIGEVRCV